jgi:hypothetical protein
MVISIGWACRRHIDVYLLKAYRSPESLCLGIHGYSQGIMIRLLLYGNMKIQANKIQVHRCAQIKTILSANDANDPKGAKKEKTKYLWLFCVLCVYRGQETTILNCSPSGFIRELFSMYVSPENLPVLEV